MENILCPKCGGILAGDWNEVECRKCGQRFNTLDVASPVVRKLDAEGFPHTKFVSRLSTSHTLVAMPVYYRD